jgi:hypothetical protein
MIPRLISTTAQWLSGTLVKSKRSERRAQKRVKAHFGAEITLSAGLLQVRGVNLHKMGLGVISSQPLKVGSTVFVRITKRGLVGFAHVRHCAEHGPLSYSVGLEFQSEPMRQEAGSWSYERISSISPVRPD